MTTRVHPVTLPSWCAVAAAALLAVPAVASADEPGGPGTPSDESAPANLMALTAPARLNAASFSVTTWAGYDAALKNPRVTASVEATLVHRFAIAVGANSSADEQGQFALRPLIALRVQALEQTATGIDATAAVAYRQDRFDVDGGFFQSTVAVGRRFDRLQVVLNLTYGIDPEGDDHEGEACAAASFEVRPSLYVGVDGRYRHDLGSSDPNRAERDRAESETLAGATAAYAHRNWAVMLEAGVSRIVTNSPRTAPVAMAGYTGTF
jgi:hypothetical protein